MFEKEEGMFRLFVKHQDYIIYEYIMNASHRASNCPVNQQKISTYSINFIVWYKNETLLIYFSKYKMWWYTDFVE